MSAEKLRLKQVNTRLDGRVERCFDTRPCRTITDNQKNEAFPLVKCIRRYVMNGQVILVWRKFTIHFWRAENDFYIFVPIDLDLWPSELKFAPLVTLVQRYVYTKLEVPAAFLLQEIRRHGTDRQTDGCIITALKQKFLNNYQNSENLLCSVVCSTW